jgi:hypothetical protein
MHLEDRRSGYSDINDINEATFQIVNDNNIERYLEMLAKTTNEIAHQLRIANDLQYQRLQLDKTENTDKD